uniref:Uncharacterized protein n=1 Tax=Arundo donax TaxID=35708 RepID=A0A0A8ZPZ6_ARUDO
MHQHQDRRILDPRKLGRPSACHAIARAKDASSSLLQAPHQAPTGSPRWSRERHSHTCAPARGPVEVQWRRAHGRGEQR